jgi:hypothetical protein
MRQLCHPVDFLEHFCCVEIVQPKQYPILRVNQIVIAFEARFEFIVFPAKHDHGLSVQRYLLNVIALYGFNYSKEALNFAKQLEVV